MGAFVRTQCDSAIAGIQDAYYDKHDNDISVFDAFDSLKKSFGEYINKKVLSKVDLSEMEIFYVGFNRNEPEYPDFEKITRYILDGGLLKQIGAKEADFSLINEN